MWGKKKKQTDEKWKGAKQGKMWHRKFCVKMQIICEKIANNTYLKINIQNQRFRV